MTAAVIAYVGLGGNVGAVVETLRAATRALERLAKTSVVAVSQLYRSPAWGLEQQADFVNGVVALRTALPAPALLQALLDLELEFGRDRHSGPRWGPRVLDLDLLLYGQDVLEMPGLRVPHPHLHERAFALVPLLEIAPDVVIPGRGPARDALARVETTAIEPIGPTEE